MIYLFQSHISFNIITYDFIYLSLHRCITVYITRYLYPFIYTLPYPLSSSFIFIHHLNIHCNSTAINTYISLSSTTTLHTHSLLILSQSQTPHQYTPNHHITTSYLLTTTLSHLLNHPVSPDSSTYHLLTSMIPGIHITGTILPLHLSPVLHRTAHLPYYPSFPILPSHRYYPYTLHTLSPYYTPITSPTHILPPYLSRLVLPIHLSGILYTYTYTYTHLHLSDWLLRYRGIGDRDEAYRYIPGGDYGGRGVRTITTNQPTYSFLPSFLPLYTPYPFNTPICHTLREWGTGHGGGGNVRIA